MHVPRGTMTVSESLWACDKQGLRPREGGRPYPGEQPRLATHTHTHIYIYIYMQSPPQNLPFQYSHLSRVQPSHAFVDVILSFCRWEWWDIALHCNALHCITIWRDRSRLDNEGLSESCPARTRRKPSWFRCGREARGVHSEVR